MGGMISSEDTAAEVKNTGNSNQNNVTINHPVEVTHDELITLVKILVVLALTSFIMKCYNMHKKYIKKQAQAKMSASRSEL